MTGGSRGLGSAVKLKVADCYRRGRARGGEDVIDEREVEVYTIERMGDGVGIEVAQRSRGSAEGAGQHVGVELGGVGLIVRYSCSRAGEGCIVSLALVVINQQRKRNDDGMLIPAIAGASLNPIPPLVPQKAPNSSSGSGMGDS
jgi:hypothetical protein